MKVASVIGVAAAGALFANAAQAGERGFASYEDCVAVLELLDPGYRCSAQADGTWDIEKIHNSGSDHKLKTPKAKKKK